MASPSSQALPPPIRLYRLAVGHYVSRAIALAAKLGLGAATNDVNMLVVSGGRQRSEAEFRELYAAAGFRLTRIVPTPSPVAVIEGEAS